MKRVVFLAVFFVLLSAAALGISGWLYRPDLTIPPGFEGRHVTVASVPLRVLEHGEGPDVLLIHGSPGCLEDWAPVVRRLLGEAHIVAYDRPGNCFSGETGDYSLIHNADLALELIETLELKDVVVAGHSYGGSTALAMAVRKPPSVRGYVIVDSATYEPSREPTALLRVLALPGLGTGLARLLGADAMRDPITAGIAQQFGERPPPPGFVDLRLRAWSTPKVTTSIANETMGSREYLAAQSPQYPTIRQPVRILAQADSAFRRDAAERLHRDVPGSTLRLVPQAGHYLQVEKPEAVVEEIRALLPNTRTGAGGA
ncbi:MAG TPA: alpha/beta hydrolase [Candidatus Limnocylindrales bacterium]|nr:alpha/beta hydrolase [Candidatus Limnocylindrales bacterium]